MWSKTWETRFTWLIRFRSRPNQFSSRSFKFKDKYLWVNKYILSHQNWLNKNNFLNYVSLIFLSDKDITFERALEKNLKSLFCKNINIFLVFLNLNLMLILIIYKECENIHYWIPSDVKTECKGKELFQLSPQY